MKAGKVIKSILALICCAVLVFSSLGLDKGSPFPADEEKAPASAMLLSDQDILYDEDAAEEMGNANINSGNGNDIDDESDQNNNEQADNKDESDKDDQQSDTSDDEKVTDNETDTSSDADGGSKPDDSDNAQASNTEQADPPEKIEDLPNVDEGGGNLPDDNPQEGDNGNPNAAPDELDKLPDIGGSGDGDKIPNEGPADNPGDRETGNFENYFTTSIINNDVLTHEKYTFTITHLKTELTVSGICVVVNGQEQTYRGIDNSFQVTLTEGANTIIVKVVYYNGTEYISASRSYTVYYSVGDDVIIITDLENIHEVSQSALTFEAYALKGEKKLGATVRLNGKAVSGTNNMFKVNLEYGENTISISAGGRNDSVTKNYTVIYKEDIFKITTTISDTVITNDTNQLDHQYEELTIRGDTEFYKFKIFINKVTGVEKIRTVRFDGEVIQLGGDGYYTIELNQRKPLYLMLNYTNSDGENRTFRYVLRFKRNGEATPENKYPTVYAQVEVGDTVINLENGLVFKNPDIITNITALSYDNEQLHYNNFTVSVNGTTLPMHSYQTGYWFGYDTYLTKEGENTITVTVSDYDGYAVTKSWRVYYEPGNVKVTISVEATTVGLGYLIPPTVVEVPGGTSVMEILTALLDRYGYTYNTNGGTYLSNISKPGICNGYGIDPELMELILEDGMDATGQGYDPKPSSMDSLGEFDFYRWSGWMYSYNGKYPGYGMNVCKPQDGAVIRIRFTLALGKDIGGFRGNMGGSYGETAGNYYKEW